jgi:hypothetical protein
MSSITAGTTSGTALVSAGDTTGDLILNVNGATASVSLKANGSIGVGATPTYGTSGQVLASRGSGAAPAWTGGLSLVSTQTASTSTSLSWTGLAGSNNYRLVLNNLALTSSGSYYILQFGTGSGPTYITSTYIYGVVSPGNSTGNTTINQQATTGSTIGSIPLLNPTFGASNTFGVSAAYDLTGFTSGYPSLFGVVTQNNVTYGANYGNVQMAGGMYTGALSSVTPITAIQITANGGATFSGAASLYYAGP